MSDTRARFVDAYQRARSQKPFLIEDVNQERQADEALLSLRAYPTNEPNYTKQRQEVIRGLSKNILADPSVRPSWERFALQEYDYTPAEVRQLQSPAPNPPNDSQVTAPLFYFPSVLPVQAIALMLSHPRGTGAGEQVDMDENAPFKLEYVHRALFHL